MKAQKANGKIIVVGSLNMDMAFQVKRVPIQGETVQGVSFVKNLGGKGANQAVACARLGAPVVMIGRVGNDAYGEQQLQALAKEGIDINYICKDTSAITGVASVWKDKDNQNRIVVVPGANNKMEKSSVEQAIENIGKASVLLTQLEIPLDIVEAALKKGKQAGAITLLNPAPAAYLPESILRMADIITPNTSEAQLLTGMPADSFENAAEAAKKLLSLGPGTVIVTMGSKGSVLVTGERVEQIPAQKVKAVDSVGAGDAYNGALAFALANGMPVAEAAVFAGYSAAVSVTRRGAQEAMPAMDEVLAFIKAGKEEMLYGKIKDTQSAAVG